MNMVNTTYKTTEDKNNKLQQLKGKTQLKFYKNICKYYDIMNIEMDEDPFSKNAQGISKVYHEVLLLMKFSRTELQVKNMNINYYDIYYTVFRNRDEKEVVNDKYENNENDFINLDVINTLNHYLGIKNDNVMLS